MRSVLACTSPAAVSAPPRCRISACRKSPSKIAHATPARLQEAITRIGPVLGQLFGQTEAPMMISTMAPADHLRADGTLATERFASAGRPAPLVTVAIMDGEGNRRPGSQGP
jgi:hypothetical protein